MTIIPTCILLLLSSKYSLFRINAFLNLGNLSKILPVHFFVSVFCLGRSMPIRAVTTIQSFPMPPGPSKRQRHLTSFTSLATRHTSNCKNRPTNIPTFDLIIDSLRLSDTMALRSKVFLPLRARVVARPFSVSRPRWEGTPLPARKPVGAFRGG